MNYNIEPSKNTSYWIYSMPVKDWNRFSKSRIKYLSSYYHNKNLKKNDIIFIYRKSGGSSGFVCVVKITTNMMENVNNIKIFDDKNNNRYIVKFDHGLDLLERVQKSRIFPFVKADKPIKVVTKGGAMIITSFKNLETFTRKFLTKPLIFFPMISKARGKKLLNKIIEIDEHNDNKSSSEEEIIESESESEEEVTESEEEQEEDANYYIPIMVIPCKGLQENMVKKRQNYQKRDYFIDHYYECNKCDVTNNNNRELTSVFSKDPSMEYLTILEDSEDNDILCDALTSYYALKNHIPAYLEDNNTEPFVRMFHINNNHEIYQGCYLITWIDNL